MKKRSKTKKILLLLLLIFLAIQVIRPSKNNGNPTGPKDITKVVAVSDSVMFMLKKSCYDCHSDYTVYPWYDQITPVNWWVNNHVNEGKRHLNFTTFGDYTADKMDKKLDGIAETIDKGEMPINSYLWMHGDAKLNEAQRKMIVDWVAVARARVHK